MFNQSRQAVTAAAAILCCLSLPALANAPVCQDKLAMNSATPTYQDTQVKQAITAIKAVEKQAGTKIKEKKVLRHEYKSAGNILILGGAEAFPM